MSSDYSRGPDYYSIRAKKEGYPARSVYKLEEIHRRFRVIPRDARLLDIGAAPGSWTLYALKVLQGRGAVTAVDLGPLTISNLPRNAAFLQGDVRSDSVREEIVARGPYDLVMSDAAPQTTGNRTVDAGRSFELVSAVLDLAQRVLRAGGNLVVKVFQGGDEGEILARLRAGFVTARAFKPKASRKGSFETYCVGLRKRNDPGADIEGESR